MLSGLTRYVCSVIHKEQSRLQVLWFIVQEHVASAPVLFCIKLLLSGSGVVSNRRVGPINPSTISGAVSGTLVFFY